MEFILILIIILIIAFILYNKKSRPASVAAEVIDQAMPALTALKDLNVHIRTTFGLEDNIIQSVETLIDRLVTLNPRLNDEFAGTEMTWVINKMSCEHLPQLVTKFTQLPIDQRTDSAVSLLESLSGLNSEIENIEKLLQDSDQSKFNTEAAYLKKKYFN